MLLNANAFNSRCRERQHNSKSAGMKLPTETLVRNTSHHQVAANRCKLMRSRQAHTRNSIRIPLSVKSQGSSGNLRGTLGRIIRMDYPHCNLFIIPDRGFILQARDNFQP
jgi:hypothetical protein